MEWRNHFAIVGFAKQRGVMWLYDHDDPQTDAATFPLQHLVLKVEMRDMPT